MNLPVNADLYDSVETKYNPKLELNPQTATPRVHFASTEGQRVGNKSATKARQNRYPKVFTTLAERDDL